MAASANAATIQNISFSVADGGEAAEITAGVLTTLFDGEFGNGDASVLVSPTSDTNPTIGLGHQYTINFTEAATISSFQLFSDYRILDAYVTLADIEFFDAANAGGASLGGATGLVFDAPSTPDPANPNPTWINPTSNVTQSVSATGALSAVITIQEVNNLTSGGTDGYQLRELSFNAAPVPEPSSIALLGMGGLALITRRRRK